jgi:sensor domain CHASE-containing protein
LEEKVAALIQKAENTAVGISRADHVTPSIRQTLALTSPTSGSRSAGIARSRTKATEFLPVFFAGFSLNMYSHVRLALFFIISFFYLPRRWKHLINTKHW